MSDLGDDYWIDLGRRWVAAGCGWMPGVRWICAREGQCDMTGRVLGAGWVYERPDLDGVWGPIDGAIPDLRDPPTVGALLAEVREAWGRPYMTPRCFPSWGWLMRDGHEDLFMPACDTEAEALVVARESAPPRKEL